MTEKKSELKCDVEGWLNEEEQSCVATHVVGLRAVEFYLHFATYDGSSSLPNGLPYAVNWNGKKQPDKKVALLPVEKRDNQTGQVIRQANVIRVLARPGQKVSLYLGSDASVDFRTVALYTVTVGSNDVRVDIHDKTGKHDDSDALTLVEKDVPTSHGDKMDKYQAALTGDIWMRFSHKYSVDEALTYATAVGLERDAEIIAVLKAVYSGQVGKGNYTTMLGGQKCRISFQQAVDKSAEANIKNGYNFATECQPRVHPHTWIATLQAARNAKVTALELSSGWRPYIGSKAHRLGLGFDVKYFQQQEGIQRSFDTRSPQLYASDAEKEAHLALVAAAKAKNDADKALKVAQDAEKRAWGEEGERLAEERVKAAKKVAQDAKLVEEEKRAAFDKIHQTTDMWSFERELLLNPLVKQVLDPFYVDLNTEDNKPGHISVEPNRQIKGDEINHKNHLHITARDKYLQPG